jgi:cystathionine beta-lyase/cystathionine gamma-synthase
MNIEPRDIEICLKDPGLPTFQGGSPTSTPIVQTSLFTFPDLASLQDGLSAEHETNVYTRGQNPTVQALELKLAALERGEMCKCFGSGMAAINAVMTSQLRAGDHVLFVNQTYGPTLQLAERLGRFGIDHDVVLDLAPEAVEARIRPDTRLMWLESPGTMTFRILDVPALTSLARERGIVTAIDNSWATPLGQKPLTLGADLVVHTASKYLSGHSDLIAGAVVGSEERMTDLFYDAFLLNGGILPPFEAWLLLRGLRTLPTRLAQHEVDALAVARFLDGHPAVAEVFHPALTGDPALRDAQLRGFTGLFSFSLVDPEWEAVRRVIDGLAHFQIGVSWGGVESLVITPDRGTNREALRESGIPPNLIRVSIGLEGADVLISDLAQALEPSS